MTKKACLRLETYKSCLPCQWFPARKHLIGSPLENTKASLNSR
ncbi:Uncharacterized protein dnm_029120 [Desulfonema magnum]|uniref:Uncharacterized protein n=1 Tax=Desulfonema magnum TaxID=45655 RepID=A0A975BJT2_9BACT|nr:Uncharacterized protein dnm_029120 [Desulfonema magnum]